jgi:hypothetical protein
MRIEIIMEMEKYEPYFGTGKREPNSAIIGFQIKFYDLKDEKEFDSIKYALTESVSNTIRDFEKAVMIGQGYW